jgi:hypothetical protein
MGHHILGFLAHFYRQSPDHKAALLVIDGMAIDQWRILEGDFSGFHLDEHAIFSWVPTLTSVSRQAIFSGRLPSEFSASIYNTSKESAHWANFWNAEQVPAGDFAYVKPQGDSEVFESLRGRVLAAALGGARVLGAVIGQIDQSLHGLPGGTGSLHAVVSSWSKTQELKNLVSELIAMDFTVFLTSDHGNVYGTGCGKPSIGETAEQRGERVIIFSDRGLRDKAKEQFTNAHVWPQAGLPHDFFPLIAPYGACFKQERQGIVSHGGISLEEVMVPFIKISRMS